MSKLLAGRYELIEKIGEGGMAVVYKAKCRLLNRYVAIKILRPEFTKDAQFVENFRQESQAAAGLQHPNIVSVYDVGTEGNIHFIVMELIDGRPLSEIIREEAPMDYKRVIDIARQVASALGVAHKHNIVHRDVKPHNIMITRDGMAKLADFGIAKAVSSSTLVSKTSKIIGSVHYFSPEQARGAYVDERSDIYSLGIVMYEMLTGQVPFDGENPVQVALMHINNEIKAPSTFAPGIPPNLEKVVMKATDKFQSNRYRNADELLHDLDNIDFVTKVVGDSIFINNDRDRDRGRARELEDIIPERERKQNRKEKNKKSYGKKKSKKPLLIVGAVVLVIAVAVGVLYASGFIGGGITVPNLTDMTPTEAKDELEELGLKMELGESEPSEDIEKGHIVSQTPDSGERVEKGDTVTVTTSSGKPTGEVPSLVGKMFDEESIVALLTSNNYTLGRVDYVESDETKDKIIRQSPAAGTELDTGSAIDIVVSKGTDKVAVPSLIGKDIETAKQLIADAGLAVGKISYEESSVYKKNQVISSSYDGGVKVKKGTTINIIVSKGKPTVTPSPSPSASPDPTPSPEPGEDDGDSEE